MNPKSWTKTFRVYFMDRTSEEKLSIVQSASKGTPIHQLSKVHKLHEQKIIEWIRKFLKY